jgi:hypothetical protein
MKLVDFAMNGAIFTLLIPQIDCFGHVGSHIYFSKTIQVMKLVAFAMNGAIFTLLIPQIDCFGHVGSHINFSKMTQVMKLVAFAMNGAIFTLLISQIDCFGHVRSQNLVSFFEAPLLKEANDPVMQCHNGSLHVKRSQCYDSQAPYMSKKTVLL